MEESVGVRAAVIHELDRLGGLKEKPKAARGKPLGAEGHDVKQVHTAARGDLWKARARGGERVRVSVQNEADRSIDTTGQADESRGASAATVKQWRRECMLSYGVAVLLRARGNQRRAGRPRQQCLDNCEGSPV